MARQLDFSAIELLYAEIAALSQAEDSAHSSGHMGIMPLAVRNDAGGPLAGTAGDYIPLTTDANGNLVIAIRGLDQSSGSYVNLPIIDSTGSGAYAIPVAPQTATEWQVVIASALQSSSHIKWGKILGTSLTASYQSLSPAVTGGATNAIQIIVFNSCDAAVDISLNAGTTKHFELDPYESFAMKFKDGILDYGLYQVTPFDMDFRVKQTSSTPTSGSVRVSYHDRANS